MFGGFAKAIFGSSNDRYVRSARRTVEKINALEGEIAAMTDEELATAAEAPRELVPALRGARDLEEARAWARDVLAPPAPVKVGAPETLERFRELRARANGGLGYADAKTLIRELKAVGGDLRALRLALTGRERGPELWTVVAALPRDEALRRVGAAMTAAGSSGGASAPDKVRVPPAKPDA